MNVRCKVVVVAAHMGVYDGKQHVEVRQITLMINATTPGIGGARMELTIIDPALWGRYVLGAEVDVEVTPL